MNGCAGSGEVSRIIETSGCGAGCTSPLTNLGTGAGASFSRTEKSGFVGVTKRRRVARGAGDVSPGTQELAVLLLAAEAHDMLDPGAIVPAPIEQHDLT